MDADPIVETESTPLDKILTPEHETIAKRFVEKYPRVLLHMLIVLITKLEDSGALPKGSVFDVITEGIERWSKNG